MFAVVAACPFVHMAFGLHGRLAGASMVLAFAAFALAAIDWLSTLKVD